MKFDIARQPLVPAFLTLIALVGLAVWGASTHTSTMPSSFTERLDRMPESMVLRFGNLLPKSLSAAASQDRRPATTTRPAAAPATASPAAASTTIATHPSATGSTPADRADTTHTALRQRGSVSEPLPCGLPASSLQALPVSLNPLGAQPRTAVRILPPATLRPETKHPNPHLLNSVDRALLHAALLGESRMGRLSQEYLAASSPIPCTATIPPCCAPTPHGELPREIPASSHEAASTAETHASDRHSLPTPENGRAEERPSASGMQGASEAQAPSGIQTGKESDHPATTTGLPTLPSTSTASPKESPRMAVRFPGEWIAQLETEHPVATRWIGGFLILLTGFFIGQMSARNNLYSVGTGLAIPLYGIILCGLDSGSLLTVCIPPTLLGLATRNYARSFRNGFEFDASFRASLYLGLLPLFAPASLPLALLLPLAVQLFHRTFRELTVAVAGLLLPTGCLCYINWCFGGELSAPVAQLYDLFLHNQLFSLVAALSLPKLLFTAALLLLSLFAGFSALSDRYSVRAKPRLILSFGFIMLLLTTALLCGPGASPDQLTLLAVPTSLLLPFLFVRIQRGLATSLYVILLASAVANVVLQ